MAEQKLIKRQILTVGSTSDLADAAARLFRDLAVQRVAASGAFFVALSGGSTPKAIYNRLVQADLLAEVPWDKIHFFVSDERCVPVSSDESNYGNAERLLLSKVGAKSTNLHPIVAPDGDPAVAASAYEKLVREIVPPGSDGFPRFDLIFLGMGPDGHTASLFPQTRAIGERERAVVENFVPKVNANRITFTFPLLNSAANVVFVVGGKDKAPVLVEILGENSVAYPSGNVMPTDGELVWILDAAAASELKS